MEAISDTAIAENLDATFARVCADHIPMVVTRGRQESVVILSMEDYRALEETAYLSRSPANARHLSESIEALEKGHGIVPSVDLSK